MDLSRFIAFEANEKGAAKSEEIDSIAQTHLAKEIQQRLRNMSDPGIDLMSARRAQAIRVKAEGGQILIDEDDQGKVIEVGPARDEAEPDQTAANLDDLFRPGSGIPESVSQPDGSTQLVFRSIKAADLFGQQIEGRRDERVERAIADVFRTKTVDSFDLAFDEVARLYPELDKR